MKDPKDPIDTEVEDAFGALAERIPDGYFDNFSSRVLARLGEASDMEARREIARGSGLVRPDEAALTAAAGGRPPGRVDPPTPRRDEIVSDEEPDTAPVPKQSGDNTGLHDIQSLASSAKRRISKRISAEAEAQDSMLLSSSSGAMKTVALPDPSKESSPEVERERIAALRQSGQMKISRSKSTTNEPPLASAAPTTLAASSAAPVSVAREVSGAGASFGAGIVAKEKSAAPWWILGGVATLAAAAAVAVFVFGVGRDKGDDAGETAATASDSQVVASAEPTPAPAPAPAAAPTVAPMPEATAPPAGSAAEGGAAAGGAVVQPLDEAKDAEEEDPEAAEPEKSDRAEREADTKGGKEKAPAPKSPAPKSTEKPLKLKGTDLNDVLNQVTGGVDAPKAEDEKKAAVPTKKSLDRRDVDTAMEPVKGAALKCSSLEQFEGSVMVKFTVAPSGQVTSASATNKKGPTGDCVAKAVKKAKFPAFDGSATSFTYPFLLAE